MKRQGTIVSYTVDEIDEMIARGESQTNWDAVRALTDEENEASIDFEDEGTPIGETAKPVSITPPGFEQRMIRIDEAILDWFKTHGEDQEAKINAVLRTYIEAQPTDGAKPTGRKAS